MKRALVLSLFLGCSTPQAKPAPGATLEGRFLLQTLTQPTSTSPQMFSAEDWAKGLTLLQNPSSIVLQKSGITAEGVLALSGSITGEVKGQQVQFMVAEDDGGTRLEIQFQGLYDPTSERIEGSLTQRWELSGEEDAAGVTLSGKATFVRKAP